MSSVRRSDIGAGGPPLGVPELIARAAAEAERLGKQKRWKPAFRDASPELPALVQRLDQPGIYYCLVGFGFGERLTGRIRLNAQTGAYAEAMGIEQPFGGLDRFKTLDDAHRQFPTGSVEPKNRTGHPPVIDPILVWQPCSQSPSPFLPFYHVRERRRQHFYRVDGTVFAELFRGAGV